MQAALYEVDHALARCEVPEDGMDVGVDEPGHDRGATGVDLMLYGGHVDVTRATHLLNAAIANHYGVGVDDRLLEVARDDRARIVDDYVAQSNPCLSWGLL